MMVDCRLGGQVRNIGLGQYRIFSNDIQKLSKAECEIRGGADGLASAADAEAPLSVWLGPATNGDATAQNRVGQIYELGIGTTVNSGEAAKWYGKAASNGSRAAALNLASLYDRGEVRRPGAKPEERGAATKSGQSKAKTATSAKSE
jgi:TPR repeat protein